MFIPNKGSDKMFVLRQYRVLSEVVCKCRLRSWKNLLSRTMNQDQKAQYIIHESRSQIMKDNEKNVKLKIAGCVDAITSCTREYNDENAFWETSY